MEDIFLRIVTISLTTSAVLLPLLLLARRICSRYAAKTCYFLWLLLALRLLVPVQLTLPRPAVTVEATAYHVALTTGRTARPTGGQAAQPKGADTPSAGPAQGAQPPARAAEYGAQEDVPVVRLLGAVWLLGAACLLLWHMGSYALARRTLLRRAKKVEGADGALLQRLREELGLRRTVALYRCYGVVTPMMLGVIRPVIVLPGEGLPGEDREVVLRHELLHLRRGDTLYQCVLALCAGVHWFNPLVWWMNREARRNLELCCDDAVLHGRGGAERRRYGELLVRTAVDCRAPAVSTHFGSGKKQLKGRLENLFRPRKNSAPLICAALVLALLAGSLVACGGGAAAAEGALSSPRAAMNALLESISYSEDTLRLTIPRGYAAQGWTIHIAGRSSDGGGMSVHYTDGTPQEQWEAGRTYEYPISRETLQALSELTLDASLPDGEGTLEDTVNLLAVISGEFRPVYRNPIYNFTLRIPEAWAGHYEVRESAGGVYFCQTGTGNGLFGLSAADAPTGERAPVAQGNGWYLYQTPLAASSDMTREELEIFSRMEEAAGGMEESVCFMPGGAAEKRGSAGLSSLEEHTLTLSDGGRYEVDPASILIELRTDACRYRERFTYEELRALMEVNPGAPFDVYLRDGRVLALSGTEELAFPEDTLYSNGEEGFSLRFPLSWSGHYEVRREDPGYYGIYFKDLEQVLLAELNCSDTPWEEVNGRTVLLGSDGAVWLYLSFAQEPEALNRLDPEAPLRRQWERMEADLAQTADWMCRFDP